MAVLAVLASCDVPTGLPRIESTFRFPVDAVVVPVTGLSATASAQADLGAIDLDDVQRGRVLVTPENGSGSTGLLTVRITGGGVVVSGVIDVAGGADQAIEVSGGEVRALLGAMATIEASGTLCRPAGCGASLPPYPDVRLENTLELVVELGGEG